MLHLINQYKIVLKMDHGDIIDTIFSFLWHKEIIICSIVNKLYNKISNDQYMKLLMIDYDIKFKYMLNMSNKETYIKCYQLTFLKNKFKKTSN